MKVLLREATDNDLELILAWRNLPLIYEGFYQQVELLTWEEHYKWWHSRHNWKQFVIQVNNGITTRDVGCVTLSQLDHWEPEIGYFLSEVTLWGMGITTKAVSLALDWLKENGYQYVSTTILDRNIASQQIVKKLNFQKTSPARKGESCWKLKLSNKPRKI